ncbi:MAG TPA: HAD hydrolase family protein [Candidatus Polarisedimenticolaceae bacterium]|nr:HAD hydrolase family protein [Candidatus Polarisedimenticolaceae bacterium]
MDPRAFGEVSDDVRQRAARVRLVLLDVDGVLTDGRIHVDSAGHDSRAFDVRDGHMIRVGQRAGLEFGLLSGRSSEAVRWRASDLEIAETHLGVHDKLPRLREILARRGTALEQTCYMGDDILDVPVLRAVGLAAAPADGVPEALEAAHYVTRGAGGRGAVRELVELVLRASGLWERAVARYLEPGQ